MSPVNVCKVTVSTTKFQKQVICTFNNSPNLIPRKSFYKYKIMNPKTSLLYGSLKVHKPNVSLKPVILYIEAVQKEK